MLAEHPDLPAQICRHQCEGEAGTTPTQQTIRQPNKRHRDRHADIERLESSPFRLAVFTSKFFAFFVL
ncbi:hypothetical protein CesoFtcFv8_015862 [Champsocephalus esox]|uniref:Uncharacterized protein n=1 Tax=Champsocephalus esox TaxID=159716 RepID=A0AAN8GPX2_9TELE|nr:hypothetical protein CesoFtcFv8_015862 [Champsocephalus esox]